MRISDWSSDVCSSDLEFFGEEVKKKLVYYPTVTREAFRNQGRVTDLITSGKLFSDLGLPPLNIENDRIMLCGSPAMLADRSEEHTSELQSLMRISYAVFCLKNKTHKQIYMNHTQREPLHKEYRTKSNYRNK